MKSAAGHPYTTRRAGPDAWEFFYHHAGWGYRPGEESEVVGRVRGALALAEAEVLAWVRNADFSWHTDPDGAEVQNDDRTWSTLPAVYCLMYDNEGTVRGSLFGITESDDWREQQDYRRVVEAEIALEAYKVER